MCLPGTKGRPGRCVPDAPVTPPCRFRDSTIIDNACVCRPGSHGTPGQCVPDEQAPPVIEQPAPTQCPADSHFDKRANGCVCNPPLRGKAGECVAVILKLPPINLPIIK